MTPPTEEEQILAILSAFEKMTTSFQSIIGKLAESMTALTGKIGEIEERMDSIEKLKDLVLEEQAGTQPSSSESVEEKNESKKEP